MFYAVIVHPGCENTEDGIPESQDLIFDDIKNAHSTLKKFKGSRMKTFDSRDKALAFLKSPNQDVSFIEEPSKTEIDIVESLEKLSLGKQKEEFPTPQPALLSKLRRLIEAGDYEKVEEMIWSNPKCLCTVCDTATYLMAGPKYNACHIAARADSSVILALLLDTISNISFLRKIYPDEPDANVQDRINHLLDSYLNTPDPRQGNTPLHFACKKGYYRIVRVLLTFEGCDIKIKDSNGHTAEESICEQLVGDGDSNLKQKIKDLFKSQLHLPFHRDQLKKRLLLAKRRNSASGNQDSDASFSDDSFFSSPIKKSF